jgi:hypothetical protein
VTQVDQKMQKISDALSRLTYLVSVPFKGFNAELGNDISYSQAKRALKYLDSINLSR